MKKEITGSRIEVLQGLFMAAQMCRRFSARFFGPLLCGVARTESAPFAPQRVPYVTHSLWDSISAQVSIGVSDQVSVDSKRC